MMRGVLALDQGSHASRACAFSEQGELIAAQAVPIRTLRRGDDEVEHDADELGESLRQATQALFSGHPQLHLERAGLATQRSTVVCFERRGAAAVSPAISWQDRRNAAWLRGFTANAARIAAITGLPLSPHYGAAKIRWCLDHLPAVQRAQSQGNLVAGPLAAFLVARLTGAVGCVDPANASRSLLFDAERLQWSDELTRLFGIDAAVLPPCAPTSAAFGTLQVAGGRIALQALTGDQSAIPFACGIPDPQTIYINLGTGAFIQRPLRSLPSPGGAILQSVLAANTVPRASPDGVWYSLEGTVNGAGSAVSWFVRQYDADEALLWREIERLPADAALPLFVNGIGGLGSPYWCASLSSRFIGAGSTLERFAAVLESVIFLIDANFVAMNQPQGADAAQLRRVIVTGGLSRSNWLCNRLAAVLEMPVLRITAEATARGVAALAAPDLAAHWPQPASELFEPQPGGMALGRRSRFAAALRTAIATSAQD